MTNDDSTPIPAEVKAIWLNSRNAAPVSVELRDPFGTRMNTKPWVFRQKGPGALWAIMQVNSIEEIRVPFHVPGLHDGAPFYFTITRGYGPVAHTVVG
jgi:hypothetical protein